MALNTMKYSFGQVAKRGLAAQAAAQHKESPDSLEVQSTMLPNKLMVASLDTKGPLSRLSVAFRTGPRNESYRNLGIVHLIRSMAGFGTQRCSGFAVWRNMPQHGVQFFCTGDREITSFNVVGARDNIHGALKFLSAVVGAPAFKPWELSDNAHRLHYEIGGINPRARVVDDLHKVAFRNGLGNSLFIEKDRINTYTTAMLTNFYNEGFTSNRCTVAGFNLYHNELLEFAKSLELNACDPLEGNSAYFGGEIRNDYSSDFAHIAIGTQGVGLKDMKEALVYSVLQYALGVPPVVPWGGSPSPLFKAVYEAAPDAGASCFSFNYSDNGLFGCLITSYADNAGKAVKEAFKVLKSGSVSEKDFKRAKSLVKMSILYNYEESENVIEDMCVQSLNGGVIIPGSVLAAAVEKITLDDVSKAARKIASGKFSMAACGHLANVPYLDELK